MRNPLVHLRCRIWRQTLLAGLTGLCFGSIAGCAFILWASRITPVVVHEIYEVSGRVARNGAIPVQIPDEVR